MKTAWIVRGALLAALLGLPLGGAAQTPAGQGFLADSGELESGAGAASSADGTAYADGMRAINQGRWADAEGIFAKVAKEHSEHAEGALYWKAYAEDKLGHAKAALDTCGALRGGYPKSRWISECGALEVEIGTRSGNPVPANASEDDEVKMLALNALMKKNESRALGEIQEILNGDSSERLKKEAQFILGQHYSDLTFAQIVRISYVEGDVRVARGEDTKKTGGATWEKAVADLPVETGFSLATGAGRAEIELEDASTLYLGENSVLTFNDLHTTAGVPTTEIALLAGTATLHVIPYMRGERFVLKTPTDRVSAVYPEKLYMRVTSYVDATGLESLTGGGLYTPAVAAPGAGAERLPAGHMTLYREGHPVDAGIANASAGFAAWDTWVAVRIANRHAATVELMKAAGLTSPIPGLAEMKGQGTFFECAPYGTCWEPADGDGGGGPNGEISESRHVSPHALQQGAHLMQASFLRSPGLRWTGAMQAASQTAPKITEREYFFPCTPTSLRYRVQRDPVTGRETVISTGIGPNPMPYAWAVCHAGSWIPRRHRYVWVVSGKRHHLAPVRWVKSGHSVAFVPLHPYDVRGRPANNRKEEIFAVNNKNGLSVERVKFAPDKEIETLKSAPKEYRSEVPAPLARTDEPRIEAHAFKEAIGSKGASVKTAGIPIHFDSKSGSFMMARQVMHGGKSETVMAPIGNRGGDLQARGSSFSGGGGSRGGSSGGGSRGGGGSVGSRGGGGSSGGSSHSSGGGSSSSTSSSNSSSSAAASSASGHH
jgi:hypothetical protein